MSDVLGEVTDRSGSRLSEIRNAIADLEDCLHDYVRNLRPADRKSLHLDREALEWMQGTLGDISATVTAIQQGVRTGGSEQWAGSGLGFSDTGSIGGKGVAETLRPVSEPDMASPDEGNLLGTGTGWEVP